METALTTIDQAADIFISAPRELESLIIASTVRFGTHFGGYSMLWL